MDKHCQGTLFRFLRSFSKSGGMNVKKPVVQHQETLETIMKDRFLSDAFHDWATQNLCSENLMFYNEVEKFRTIRDLNLMTSEAHRIYARYIRIRSVAEVNLDYEVRVTIEQSLDNPTPSIFDEAKFAVLDLLQYDLYLKFIDSDIYRDCKGLPSAHRYPIQRRRNVHLADMPHLTHDQIASLAQCLHDPLALDEFLKFAYTEHSDAVIQFYLDVERYEVSPSVEFACSIYGKFLGESSEEAVDADPKITKSIYHELQKGESPPQLFSYLKDCAFLVMSQDNFMRFQNFVISSLALV